MKILICGAGAIGSNLTEMLACDLKGEHEISVLDYDTVEERNIRAGTQFYTSDTLEMPKVEALEYLVYKMRNRKITPINEKLTRENANSLLHDYDLVIDCMDNMEARKLSRAGKFVDEVLHIGFSDKMTFAIEWDKNYQVPEDITSGIDICELEGVASFVRVVAALGSLIVQDFMNTEAKREFIGNKFLIKEML